MPERVRGCGVQRGPLRRGGDGQGRRPVGGYAIQARLVGCAQREREALVGGQRLCGVMAVAVAAADLVAGGVPGDQDRAGVVRVEGDGAAGGLVTGEADLLGEVDGLADGRVSASVG